jgi:trigger factor
MKTTQETASNGRLHLSVWATAEELKPYLAAAAASLIEDEGLDMKADAEGVAALCADKAYQNGIRGRVMERLAPSALKNAGVAPITQLIYLTKDTVEPGRPFEYIVSLIPQPSVELSSYDPVELHISQGTVSGEDIDRALAQWAARHSALQPEGTAARVASDDYVEIETQARRNGEEYELLTAKKRLYHLGEGFLPEAFDDGLWGMRNAETKTFPLILDKGGDPIEVTVTILGIYRDRAPKIDDAWVRRNCQGMDSLKELRASLEQELLEGRHQEFEQEKAQRAVAALSRRVQTKIPDEVFHARFQEAYRGFCKDITNSQGISIEEFINRENMTERQLKEEMMEDVHEYLLQALALDAYAKHWDVTPGEDDLRKVLSDMAAGSEDLLRIEYEKSGRMHIIEEAARRSRATEKLTAEALLPPSA